MTAEELVRKVLAKQNPDDATVAAVAKKIQAYIDKVTQKTAPQNLRSPRQRDTK